MGDTSELRKLCSGVKFTLVCNNTKVPCKNNEMSVDITTNLCIPVVEKKQ